MIDSDAVALAVLRARPSQARKVKPGMAPLAFGPELTKRTRASGPSRSGLLAVPASACQLAPASTLYCQVPSAVNAEGTAVTAIP